jgi:hypothetical protein
MADQYTRTVCGGSPLAATEPIVGLLLGTMEAAKTTGTTGASASLAMSAGFVVTVTHAEDVPVYADAAFQTARQAHVTLHQAVYGSHVVVGWYRVASQKTTSSATNMDEEDWSSPTPKDLLISQQLALEYATASTTQGTDVVSGNTGTKPFLFALLLVDDGDDDTKKNATKPTPMVSAMSDQNVNDDEEDTLLPLQLFAVDTMDQVLVGLDPETTWTLATAIPERIAVERALHETPSNNNSNMVLQSSRPLLESLCALAARRASVERYVQAVHNGTVPWDGVLLRRIQGLLLLAGVLSSSHSATASANDDDGGKDEMTKASEMNPTEPSSRSSWMAPDSASAAAAATMQEDLALLLQQVSALATAVATVQEYTDNARAIHEDRQKLHSSYGGGSSSTMRPLGRALWSGTASGGFF